jgi:FAD/FMN-containing dehydrogenase/Fe-S oxidoreductase
LPKNKSTPLLDLINSLDGKVRGEFRTDKVTRILYRTDASIYQIEPIGVFTPYDVDELAASVKAASLYGIPILPRGSGSSLAGQAIGSALIIDCSPKLNRIIDINPEDRTAIVEPGVILVSLNHSAAKFGLHFGPDPASAEQASMGGVLANNATGAHSIRYGMSADHIHSTEAILSDGSIVNLEEVSFREALHKAGLQIREGEIYRAMISIRENKCVLIKREWPRTWRRSSGYNLNYLIPWTPSFPPQWSSFNYYPPSAVHPSKSLPYPPISQGTVNLSSLIAGSEGTLGVIRKATVRLVPLPTHSCLVLLPFPDIASACEEVINLLELQPSAIELIPANMIGLARKVPTYAHQVSILDELQLAYDREPNILTVEFVGDDIQHIHHQVGQLLENISSPFLLAEDPNLQNQIWNVRKVGLGLLMSKPSDTKPIPFLEDLSVPVERLKEFVLEMERILVAHNTEGDFYAHASSGCLHIRPLLNLKTVQGINSLREIASDAIDLIIRLGGSPSGEHGDGIARSEWLDKVFGSQILEAFRELKLAADPVGILNPGKITDPLPMEENLRFGSGYSAKSWQPVFDFSSQSGMVAAVELCNGAGVCRKIDGTMCPSFQATKDEHHSTRGRANLLRAMYSNRLPLEELETLQIIYEALDLCLACKGCKAECPSAVNMAKLKYEFLEYYYHQEKVARHLLRDYVFAHIDNITRYGSYFTPIVNAFLRNLDKIGMRERWLGLSCQRTLPRIDSRPFHVQWKKVSSSLLNNGSPKERVLFLSDPFTEYYQPQVGFTALNVLSAIGCDVEIIPIIGSGHTYLSKGYLKSARAHAGKVIESVNANRGENFPPIISVEPSEIYTLRDEYLDLFPNRDDVKLIAEQVFMLDEFLVRPGEDGEPRVLRIANFSNLNHRNHKKVLLHGHCYQKAQPPAEDGFPTGVKATVDMLERVAFQVEELDTGCCGMAGSFTKDDIVVASGFSCLTQIKDGKCRINAPFDRI